MLEEIFRSSTFDYMSRGLAAANLRQEVISNNVANVNTPNYKKSIVEFEEMLAKELRLTDDGRMPVVRTHDRHIPIGFPGKAQAQIHHITDTTMRVDGNNVDIDAEMANLAKNQLYYNAMATQLGGYINKLKSVISSGQSQ